MTKNDRENGHNLLSIEKALPSIFRSLLSLIYLRISGLRVGWSLNILAFSVVNGKIQTKIKSGRGSIIGKHVTLKASLVMEEDVFIDNKCFILKGPVFIGRGTNFMFRSEIVGSVSIGRFCAIARNCIFQAENHIINRPSIQRGIYSNILKEKLPSMEKKGIIIGNDVWIGTRAIILPGVKIGDGAVVGAGSIVTKNVDPYSIIAGVPASHKKWRFSENIRAQLQEIKWWEWDIEKIKRNKEFFMTDLTKVNDIYKLIKK